MNWWIVLLAFEIGCLAGCVFALWWIGAKRKPWVVDYVVVEITVDGKESSRHGIESCKEVRWN